MQLEQCDELRFSMRSEGHDRLCHELLALCAVSQQPHQYRYSLIGHLVAEVCNGGASCSPHLPVLIFQRFQKDLLDLSAHLDRSKPPNRPYYHAFEGSLLARVAFAVGLDKRVQGHWYLRIRFSNCAECTDYRFSYPCSFFPEELRAQGLDDLRSYRLSAFVASSNCAGVSSSCLQTDRRVKQILINPWQKALYVHRVKRLQYSDLEVLKEVLAAQSIVFEHAPKVVVTNLDDAGERSEEISRRNLDGRLFGLFCAQLTILKVLRVYQRLVLVACRGLLIQKFSRF